MDDMAGGGFHLDGETAFDMNGNRTIHVVGADDYDVATRGAKMTEELIPLKVVVHIIETGQ